MLVRTKKVVKQKTYYSRVDIELVTEQVRLFFSKLDEVSIEITDNQFKITEYVHLGLQKSFKYYPLEETVIDFSNNTAYSIDSKLLFDPPQFDKKVLHHIYNTNNKIIEKLKKGIKLTKSEEIDLNNLPATYLICYLNLFQEAINKLKEAKVVIKKHSEKVYEMYKDTMRILRKVKYS